MKAKGMLGKSREEGRREREVERRSGDGVRRVEKKNGKILIQFNLSKKIATPAAQTHTHTHTHNNNNKNSEFFFFFLI